MAVNPNQVEQSVKTLDKLTFKFERFQVRFEEVYLSHLHTPVGTEVMCLIFSLGNGEFKTPEAAELTSDKFWSHTIPTDSSLLLNIRKVIKFTNFSIFCCVDESISKLSDDSININYVRHNFSKLRSSCLYGPSETVAKVDCYYNKGMSLFGPTRVRVDLFGVDIRISDEQIVFLAKAVHRLNWQVRECGRQYV